MKNGKRHMTERIELPNQEKETYKYLGILEVDTIKWEMKKKLKRVS